MKQSERIKELEQQAQTMHVVKEVDTDSGMMHTALGITNERKNELSDILKGLMRNRNIKSNSSCLHEISLKCKHVNEVAWVAYTLGRNHSDVAVPLINMDVAEAIAELIRKHRPGNKGND